MAVALRQRAQQAWRGAELDSGAGTAPTIGRPKTTRHLGRPIHGSDVGGGDQGADSSSSRCEDAAGGAQDGGDSL